jgi:hypothetical protein
MRQNRWDSDNWSAWRRLAAAIAAIAALWLGVLPLVARQPGIQAYVERNEALGIDPSAKFYTELPLMPEIFDRIQSLQRRAERNRAENRNAFNSAP